MDVEQEFDVELADRLRERSVPKRRRQNDVEPVPGRRGSDERPPRTLRLVVTTARISGDSGAASSASQALCARDSSATTTTHSGRLLRSQFLVATASR